MSCPYNNNKSYTLLRYCHEETRVPCSSQLLVSLSTIDFWSRTCAQYRRKLYLKILMFVFLAYITSNIVSIYNSPFAAVFQWTTVSLDMLGRWTKGWRARIPKGTRISSDMHMSRQSKIQVVSKAHFHNMHLLWFCHNHEFKYYYCISQTTLQSQ